MIFRIPGDTEFGFRGEQIPAPLTWCQLLQLGGCYAVDVRVIWLLCRDTVVEIGRVDNVPVVCEFS